MKFENLDEYGRAELATRYRSTAGSQAQVDEGVLDPLLQSVEGHGYVIVPDLIDEETRDEIRRDIEPRFQYDAGRNNFEGFATQRLYGVIEKTSVCNALVEHPLVLGLLDRLLEPNYLLSQLQVINICAGEAQQPIHHDDAFYRVPRPRAPLGAATIFAIDDFTADNGATVVIPGSHEWDDRAPTADDVARQVPAVMPAGSMLFFIGTTWHAGGENRTASGRMCVTAQYCSPWVRQQENFSLSVSRERATQCSEHIQRLLGYSIHPPFMGFVDGKHPKRLLE